MKFLKETFYLILLLSCGISAQGQIEITFPSERAVFQRTNGNATIFFIAGHYRSSIDRIEARFTPIQGGIAIDWTTIENSPQNGLFRGSLVVSGGWYKLEVRGIKNEEVLFQSQVSKVGVGEVFVIAGQSNAQGYLNNGQKGPNDDRVNVINNYSFQGVGKPAYPTFAKLEAESKIAPTGNGAWCWGTLGDMLTNKLNVPVLFINTAWEGYEVAQFVRSSFGESGINTYSQIVAPKGFPFSSISNSLHYYTNLTGMRCILWHQGETDNYLSTPKEVYVDLLKTLIDQTRNATGKNLTWLVSRASRNERRFYPTVIEAQNTVIASTENVFEGPNTDEIAERIDGVHFSSTGLERLAESWNASLNQNFFAASNPQMGNPPLRLNQNCTEDSDLSKPLEIAAPQGYLAYEWSNGDRNTITRLGQGLYQGSATDKFGNVYYSAPLSIKNDLIPPKPSIAALGQTEFCVGESVELEANVESNIVWSGNLTGKRIRVSSPGLYQATHINIYGCRTTSNPIEIKNLPTPNPQITASGPTDICSDQELTIVANGAANLKWNTGEQSNEIKVKQSGTYFAFAKNEFGCEGKSEEINVTIKPAAKTPSIFNNGMEEFCENDSTELVVSSEEDFKWNVGTTSPTLIIKEPGTYFATAVNSFGCMAKSNEIKIIVNPSPTKPSIMAIGPTVFCDNSSVLLTGPDAEAYQWSNGSTQKEIEIAQTSSLLLRVSNQFGCVSPTSDQVDVLALSSPKNPSVIQTGTFTLSASFSGDTSDIQYIWKLNGEKVESNTARIKARTQGNYSVTGVKNYTLPNGNTFTCSSSASNELNFLFSREAKEFSVYPNPNYVKEMKIETLEDVDKATISIFDLSGKLHRTYFVPLFDEAKTFDLTGVPHGEYVIKIKNNRTKYTSKLLIR